MSDQKEPSDQPEDREERVAKWVHAWLFTDSTLWDKIRLALEKDPYRRLANRILANYVSKEEHERIVGELKFQLRGDYDQED